MNASSAVFSDVPARVPTPKRRCLSLTSIARNDRSPDWFAAFTTLPTRPPLRKVIQQDARPAPQAGGCRSRCEDAFGAEAVTEDAEADAADAEARSSTSPPSRPNQRPRSTRRRRGCFWAENHDLLRWLRSLTPAPPCPRGVNNVGSVQKRRGRRIVKRRLDAGRCRVSKFACGARRARQTANPSFA